MGAPSLVSSTSGKPDAHIYVYGYLYNYWEQYLHSTDNFLQACGLSVLGVFIATLLFQFSPTSSFIIVAVIVMVVAEMYDAIFMFALAGLSKASAMLSLHFVCVGTGQYRSRESV